MRYAMRFKRDFGSVAKNSAFWRDFASVLVCRLLARLLYTECAPFLCAGFRIEPFWDCFAMPLIVPHAYAS